MAEAPAPAAAGPLSDAEVEKLLRAREEQEQKDARAAVQDLEPGPCPACDGGVLVAKPSVWTQLLRPLVKRDALRCGNCKLETLACPTFLGLRLADLLTAVLVLGGMSAIFTAQRITDPGSQKMSFLFGALLFAGGLAVGYGLHGAASTKQTAARIVARRRRRADKAAGAAKPTETSSWFQENLEAVVVAIILALIIRHFAMEAFVIPTGSMAPTLLGDHFDVRCDNCGNGFSLSKNEGEFSLRGVTEANAQCPQCDHRFARERTRTDVQGGHKILVNKFLYKLRPPRRYEVIVFKYPKAPWRNYIKRLVGLPGEKLRVRNGDLFVNDKIARKPDVVQDAIWIPVHDARNRRESGAPMWKAVNEGKEPAGVWSFGKNGQDDLDGAWIRCQPNQVDGGPPSWLKYTRQIYDRYGYNRVQGFGRDNQVADLRLRARVTAQDGAVVRLATLEATTDEDGRKTPFRTVAACFPCGSGAGTYAIEVDGEVQATAQATALRPGTPAEIALSYADDRARLIVDGETVIAWEDTAFAPRTTFSSNLRLSAAKAEVVFEDLRIDRDVYYVPSVYEQTDPSKRDIKVPEGSYFVMGDNSPNSEDGRKWGFVREGHLIGRAFMVFWPIVPMQLKLIR